MIEQDAVISDCGLYRYTLLRRWSEAPLLGAIWLNPSTADASQDDASLRRGMSFARREGYGGLLLGNLAAYRAKNFHDLLNSHQAGMDVVGSENRDWLIHIAETTKHVFCGWGSNAKHPIIAEQAMKAISVLRELDVKAYHLGLTLDNYPRHPLYLRGDAPFTEWLRADDAKLKGEENGA